MGKYKYKYIWVDKKGKYNYKYKYLDWYLQIQKYNICHTLHYTLHSTHYTLHTKLYTQNTKYLGAHFIQNTKTRPLRTYRCTVGTWHGPGAVQYCPAIRAVTEYTDRILGNPIKTSPKVPEDDIH